MKLGKNANGYPTIEGLTEVDADLLGRLTPEELRRYFDELIRRVQQDAKTKESSNN